LGVIRKSGLLRITPKKIERFKRGINQKIARVDAISDKGRIAGTSRGKGNELGARVKMGEPKRDRLRTLKREALHRG